MVLEDFPGLRSESGQRFVWTHHGSEGPLGYVVTLGLEQEAGQTTSGVEHLLPAVLHSTSAFGNLVPGRPHIRVICFEPDQLKAFDLAEIAGWFKASSDRIYSAAAPLAEFEVSLGLAAGVHKIEVPAEMQTVDELIVPTTYAAMSPDDPAMALYVFYPQAGLVEVLPQKWFTASNTSGKAMDHARGPRSRVAPDFWRGHSDRQFSSGRRRLPPARVD